MQEYEYDIQLRGYDPKSGGITQDIHTLNLEEMKDGSSFPFVAQYSRERRTELPGTTSFDDLSLPVREVPS
jgi:hypothetical protein